ncbi:aldose epimerase [Actinoalloteichus sp. AHMU CJ021]|uniref:aldose 1-epimerase family protein n=1 Tax=Actinoalloteichus sp. AHMU CJ021 TaxID=2072503 RepID=UPI000CA07D05|nr:aldose epimerase [Actinoalloteichus sp. AHMU CJ021]
MSRSTERSAGSALSRRAALGAAGGLGLLGVTGIAGTSQASTADGPGTHPATGPRPPVGEATGRLYEIRAGRHAVVVAGVAATLLSWKVDGEERLLTHEPHSVGDSYQGKTIVPWPNRIDRGHYTFDDAEYQVPVNEPERNTALHGLVNWVEWEPVEHSRDRVVLDYQLHPQYGYPFRLGLRMEYAVSARGIRARLTATNLGRARAPFGAAFHPYFQLGSETIDDMRVRLPADAYYTVDDRLLPTGIAEVDGTGMDFRVPRELGTTELDTAYTRLLREADGTAVTRLSRRGGPTIELWVDENYRYLQVYTDDGPPPGRAGRAGITVEPMTCAPDAFNSGDGLVLLDPGAEFHGSWGLRSA